MLSATRGAHFQLSSPPPPPVFQAFAFCGADGFSPPPPPQSHFSWFSLDQRLREKQFLAPCLLLAWSFTSSSLTKWGRERLTRALSLGGGAILAEVVAVLSDLWKVPEHLGEARSSGYQLLSLVRAGLWEACGAMSVDGSRSCSHPALPRI